jgi:oligosaccharide repeat unit polymerase
MNQGIRGDGYRAAIPIVLGVVCSMALGLALVVFHLRTLAFESTSVSIAALVVVAAASLIALRGRGIVGFVQAGPGSQIVLLVLCVAFAVGVVTAKFEPGVDTIRVTVLYLLAIVAFSIGAVGTSWALGLSKGPVRVNTARSAVTHPWIVLLVCGLIVAAVANLVTGSVPLLAESINTARLGGEGGIFGRFWAWIIGGLEWCVLVAMIRTLYVRRLEVYTLGVGVLSLSILVLLAGRSFLVVVGLAMMISVALVSRLSMAKLIGGAAAAILLLGLAGLYRYQHSSITPVPYGGAVSVVEQSAGIGPEVFGTVLHRVPAEVPYQDGSFLLRDFRALLPLHPLGTPEAGDLWVTKVLRQRDPVSIGGTPPTLAGGLYIDFGVPGIAIGSAILAVVLGFAYRWVRRVPTIGAISAYSYFAAYIALSAYSYVSVKPALLAVIGLALMLHMLERASVDGRTLESGEA